MAGVGRARKKGRMLSVENLRKSVKSADDLLALFACFVVLAAVSHISFLFVCFVLFVVKAWIPAFAGLTYISAFIGGSVLSVCSVISVAIRL